MRIIKKEILTEASPRDNCSSMARRMGSPSAAKARSNECREY